MGNWPETGVLLPGALPWRPDTQWSPQRLSSTCTGSPSHQPLQRKEVSQPASCPSLLMGGGEQVPVGWGKLGRGSPCEPAQKTLLLVSGRTPPHPTLHTSVPAQPPPVVNTFLMADAAARRQHHVLGTTATADPAGGWDGGVHGGRLKVPV